MDINVYLVFEQLKQAVVGFFRESQVSMEFRYFWASAVPTLLEYQGPLYL